MKRMNIRILLSICIAALWVLALCGGVQAQGKGKKQGADQKNKKKNEQMTEKKKGKQEQKGQEAAGAGSQKEAEQGTAAHHPRYKPKHMSDEDMMEWRNGDPPGWSRGNKTGWDGAGAPPGQMKKQGDRMQERDRERIHIYPPQAGDWDAKKKTDWDARMEQLRSKILERMKSRSDMPEADRECAMASFDGAAGRGVPLETTEAVIGNAVLRRMSGRNIEQMTRAMAYGADKNTDYDKLGRFVNKRIDEGESGDDIAIEVYKEIDDGRMQVKKPWYKRWFNR